MPHNEQCRWFVMYSKAHKEAVAEFQLRLKGLDVFYPRLLLPESLRKPNRIIPFLKISLLTVGAITVLLGAAKATPAQTCISCINFTVGPAEKVLGPISTPADSQVVAINTDTGVRAYSANGQTFRLDGPDLKNLILNTVPIVSGGSAGTFDECGAWLQSVEQDGNMIRAWYHAEEDCNYGIGQTRKSVAYAESTDGGMTFSKPNYPGNQVITDPNPFQTGSQTGQGDQSVIKWGNYYWMYFLTTDDVWKTGVARAPLTSGGVPGSWMKWYKGSFSEPGIGGSSSPIGFFGPSASIYGPGNNIALLTDDQWFGGVRMSFSDDGLNFQDMQEPLLPFDQSDWVRDSTKKELIAYSSVVPPNGGKTWNDSEGFYLFYTYLQPGEDFNNRYLVRRKVDLNTSQAGVSPQVTLALTRYYSQSNQDHWATTAMVPDNYSFDKTISYIFTKPQAGMTKLVDCYIYALGWDDHMVGTTDCGGGEVKELRTLGWVWASQMPGTVPIYRCFNSSSTNYLISVDPGCEGLGTAEFIIGYGASADTVSPSVTITSPAPGSTIPSQGKLTISASAADNVGITKIELFFDNKLVRSCANASMCTHKMPVSKIIRGNHTVSAKSYDASANPPGTASISVHK